MLIGNKGHSGFAAIGSFKQDVLDDYWTGIGIDPYLHFQIIMIVV